MERRRRAPDSPERRARDKGRFVKGAPNTRVDAAQLLVKRLGPGPVADAITQRMLEDLNSPAIAALTEDLEIAPLVETEEINRLVDKGNARSLGGVAQPVLSEMQLSTIRELAAGADYPEIARRLGIKRGSVATHAERARVRLGAKTNAHAISIAIGSGLIQPEHRVHAGEGKLIGRSLFTRPSKSEGEILVRLAKGLSYAEIAEERGVSIETVKQQVKDILKLYGARNSTQAVAAAFIVGTLRFVSSRHRPKN